MTMMVPQMAQGQQSIADGRVRCIGRKGYTCTAGVLCLRAAQGAASRVQRTCALAQVAVLPECIFQSFHALDRLVCRRAGLPEQQLRPISRQHMQHTPAAGQRTRSHWAR